MVLHTGPWFDSWPWFGENSHAKIEYFSFLLDLLSKGKRNLTEQTLCLSHSRFLSCQLAKLVTAPVGAGGCGVENT